MAKSVLVVEGNARATSDVMESLGGAPYGVSYAALLKSLSPGIETDVVYPAENGPGCLAEGKNLSGYDGIVWTGSALNCYNDAPEVVNQIWLAKAAFVTGVPIFGSCWGMQVMTMALGGTVRCNPKGRELGIGHDITLTNEGLSHPMYTNKEGRFDAIEVHMDEVDTLPEGAVVLAGNAMSSVQAMSIERDGGSFWGVQYHPEFDFSIMAIVMQRLTPAVLEEGLFESEDEVKALIDTYRGLDVDEVKRAGLGISASVGDPTLRRLEIFNWLKARVGV